MWNMEEIKRHKKYCITRLLNDNLSEEEKVNLKLTINTYLYMLDSSGTLNYTLFPNIVDIVTKGKYTLYKKNKYKKIIGNIGVSGNVEYDELVFLINLLMKLAEVDINYDELVFDKVNINDKKLISVAKEYYENFPDKEISDIALNILNMSSNINFTRNMRYKKKYLGGNIFRDYIFDKTYVNIYIHDIINDYNSIVHEIMHCVDFSYLPKNPNKYHKVINEIPGYLSDFLFIDYLEQIEFNKTETNKIRKQSIFTIYSVINNTLNEIKQNYFNMNGIEISEYIPIQFIINSLNPEIISQLLEIKSVIVSYGLYLQIINNPTYGFDNFKKYMKNGKTIKSDLEFDYIGLSNQKLLEIAEEFKDHSESIVNSSNLYYK